MADKVSNSLNYSPSLLSFHSNIKSLIRANIRIEEENVNIGEWEEDINDRNVIWEPITPEPIPQWYLNFLTYDDNDQIEPTGLELDNNESPNQIDLEETSSEEDTISSDWESMSGSKNVHNATEMNIYFI